MKKIQLGKIGEDRAVEYLTQLGYVIIERNFRTKFGEIDIIAKDAQTFCFVEVRTKTSEWHGHPFESITAQKRRRLTLSAWIYIQNHNLEQQNLRFDVVAVQPQSDGSYHLDLIKDAFEAQISDM